MLFIIAFAGNFDFKILQPQLFRASLTSGFAKTEPEEMPEAEENLASAPLTPQEFQNQLDDIQEKLDIISRQIADLFPAPLEQIENPEPAEENVEQEKTDEDKKEEKTEPEEPPPDNLEEPSPPKSVHNGGAAEKPVYPKILISEVQILPVKQRFVELYNPNDSPIDLTGWYLQRKTATGDDYQSFITKTDFSGKVISAKSYFLISREIPNSSILLDITLSDDNSLAFKNPNREISDTLGWGQAQDFESAAAQNFESGRSLGRNPEEQDTDNNSADFELNTPTPKEENIRYEEPLPEPVIAPTDATPPVVEFSFAAIQTSLAFSIDFKITDPLDAVATPSGVAVYVFRFKQDGADWQEDSPAEVSENPVSADLTRDFPGEDGKTYYFQAKAKDVAGNESDFLPEPPATTMVSVPPVITKNILINEIQTAGLNDEKEEFVELFNPNSVDIDLAGWYIQRKTKAGSEYSSFAPSTLFAGKNIKANDFILIARQDSIFVTADIFTGYTLGDFNIDGGSTLVLKKPNHDVSDEVGWGAAQDFEIAPAPNPCKGQSITRTSGIDTENNSVDFIISDTPTPKN